MTLDNDANPSPHAPRFPSDAPPREGAGRCAEGAQTGAGGVAAPARAPIAAPVQSTDRPDATTPRGVARAILDALAPAERAAVIAAVLSWCRALAGLASAVSAGLARPSALAMGDAAARVLTGDVTEVNEVDAAAGAPFAPVAALLGAWWQSGPYDLARGVAQGSVSAGDFADALAFLAELDDGRALDAPALPRVVRCPMPAGVDRVDLPGRGVTFLPPSTSSAVTRDAIIALAARAARELGAVDPARTGGYVDTVTLAERATLTVLGAAHAGEGAGSPVHELVEMAEHCASVAALSCMDIGRSGDPLALTFRDRCDAAAALMGVALDTIRAARAMAEAGESIDDARWPADDRGAA